MKLIDIQFNVNKIIDKLYAQEGDVMVEDISIEKQNDGCYTVTLKFIRSYDKELCGISVYFK